MSNTEELKNYLIDEADGFLLNDDNNGKTIMLSGSWGVGKTHFWQKTIEPVLSKKLKEHKSSDGVDDAKASVYVSLYGKDNIESLKNEILFKAYESIKDENKLAKRAISAFGFGSRLLSVSVGGVRANTSAVGDALEGFFESKKIDEAESFIVDGGIICLDDFERKSKHIDLNDLFGFIAQLAIDMNCKIVIILNSDVFEGEEANVFKNVKEKTVNKYFHFEPTPKELFDSVAKDEKYNKLNEYKEEILKAIEETEELNARIYIQVLDNCLEWIDKGYDDFDENFTALSFSTIAFYKHNLLLPFYMKKKVAGRFIGGEEIIYYSFMEKYPNSILDTFSEDQSLTEDEFFQKLLTTATNEDRIKDELMRDYCKTWIVINEHNVKAVWKYGYRLFISGDIDESTYKKIFEFIKTGILPKKTKEVESSLPPEAITATEV